MTRNDPSITPVSELPLFSQPHPDGVYVSFGLRDKVVRPRHLEEILPGLRVAAPNFPYGMTPLDYLARSDPNCCQLGLNVFVGHGINSPLRLSRCKQSKYGFASHNHGVLSDPVNPITEIAAAVTPAT